MASGSIRQKQSPLSSDRVDVVLVERRPEAGANPDNTPTGADLWLKTGNIAAAIISLADLGFPDAGELTAKTILAKKLNDVIDSRHLTQSDAAELLEMPQPKVSAIRNYELRGVSLERLRRALTALG